MNQLLPALFLALMLVFSCEETTTHIEFNAEDSIPPVTAGEISTGNNYLGTIPGMDAQVVDYTLPNPYQHKSQLFRDSTQSMSWDEAGFPDGKSFVLFFKQFQFEVIDRKKELIAAHIDYPIRGFKNKEAFINSFDSIFGKEFVDEIIHQDPLQIYRNKNGAMIGDDGQLWFKMIGGAYKIFEINP